MTTLINKNNIFDFATSELSHSAFFAWLISQIDPQSDYSLEVRNQAIELLNQCLKTHKFESIKGLNEIKSVIVKRELKQIDIVVFINTRSGRNIGLIIENKVGAQESRRNQLKDYYAEGTKIIDEHFKSLNNEKIFIYLKSDYDYDDPLTRFDKDRNIIPTNFKKINLAELFKIFDINKNFEDSILKSYASWVKYKYENVMYKLDVKRLLSINEGINLLKNDHIGQTFLIKKIFTKFFSNNSHPICSERDKNSYHRYYYSNDIFIKLGTDKGSPWTELWFSEISDASYFYRIQLNKPDPLIHARLGYWGEDDDRSNEKQKLHDQYIALIDKNKLSDHRASFKFNPNNFVSSMCAFNILGKPIEVLQKIEDLHLEFLTVI